MRQQSIPTKQVRYSRIGLDLTVRTEDIWHRLTRLRLKTQTSSGPRARLSTLAAYHFIQPNIAREHQIHCCPDGHLSKGTHRLQGSFNIGLLRNKRFSTKTSRRSDRHIPLAGLSPTLIISVV